MTRSTNWRVGSKIQLNVYEGDRPVCQCHSAEDARRIVDALAAVEEFEEWKTAAEFTLPETAKYRLLVPQLRAQVAELAEALRPFVRYIRKRHEILSKNSVAAYPTLMLSGAQHTADLLPEDWDHAAAALAKVEVPRG